MNNRQSSRVAPRVSTAKLFDAAKFLSGSGDRRIEVAPNTAKMLLKSATARNGNNKPKQKQQVKYLRRRTNSR